MSGCFLKHGVGMCWKCKTSNQSNHINQNRLFQIKLRASPRQHAQVKLRNSHKFTL